ncbi:hypothetical protein D1872_272790 [compost metagenome]
MNDTVQALVMLSQFIHELNIICFYTRLDGVLLIVPFFKPLPSLYSHHRMTGAPHALHQFLTNPQLVFED